MINEAADFAQECDALAALLAPLDDPDFERETQFKGWTLNDILAHLYMGDTNAWRTLSDPAGYLEAREHRRAATAAGATLPGYQRERTGGLEGQALAGAWKQSAGETAAAYADADPRQRVEWSGPSMSARSSITARLMETWSHAQAIYDLLGVERHDRDHIRAVAHLGAITFGWTFTNRDETPPGPPPWLRLTAPRSGTIWEWNAEHAHGPDRIVGPATDFCQVVTQTRNVADVGLTVTGPVASAWMARAQCFAGPPNDPPAPGTRYRR